jgi:hypothetical protein
MAGWPESLPWIVLLNAGLGSLVFVVCLLMSGVARWLGREGVPAIWPGARPDRSPVDEWPLFTTSVSMPRDPADPHTLDLPGLGLTMSDGGVRVDGGPSGLSPGAPIVLPFSIRMPGTPVRGGADPDVTFSVRSGDAVYSVTHSALSGPLRGLPARKVLEELTAGTYRALARSGRCRVLGTSCRSLAGRPARISRFEVRPPRQAPYVLATALLLLDGRALAVSYGDRARRFRKARFARYLATLELPKEPPDPA